LIFLSNREEDEKIRDNLFLDEDSFWYEIRDLAREVHREAQKKPDLGYCLENQFEAEKDFYNDIGMRLEIVRYYDEIILFRKIEKERDEE
jgi:hypothetical protein